MTLLAQSGQLKTGLTDHLFGEGLLMHFIMRVCHERLSICSCHSFLFGFEGRMQDLLVFIRDHYLLFHLNGKASLRLLQWCPTDIAELCDENTKFYDLIKLFV